MRIVIALAAILLLNAPILAKKPETGIKATNGTKVYSSRDDFADRSEFSTEPIEFDYFREGVSGDFFAAKVAERGKVSRLSIQVAIRYLNPWRYYETAVLKGGEPVQVRNIRRETGYCQGASCLLGELISITPTPEQVAKYGQNGHLDIQLRSNDLQTFLISVPLQHIEAINEVAK